MGQISVYEISKFYQFKSLINDYIKFKISGFMNFMNAWIYVFISRKFDRYEIYLYL